LATPNIKEEIKKLVSLQEVDKKIYQLTKEKADLPKQLQEIQMEFEEKKANYKALEDKRQKLILKQKEKEGELATKEENIKKSQGQLGQLKTNKEYQAKLSEIESLKADKSIIEEEILKAMDELDQVKNELETEKNALAGEEKIYNEKKNIINSRGKDIESQLSDASGKRKILSDSVDKKILEKYEHILHGKEGLAIVKVQNNSCAGCFMSVPHQVVNEIKMHERLITCEICSRILYLEEDVEAI